MKYQVTKDDFLPKLIAALRSGTYSKATGALQRLPREGVTGGFCCLGVLCEIAGIEADKTSSGVEGLTNAVYEGNTGVLPDRLAAAIDVSAHGDFQQPVKFNDRTFDSLVQLNDRHDTTFDDIADVLEGLAAQGNGLKRYGM